MSRLERRTTPIRLLTAAGVVAGLAGAIGACATDRSTIPERLSDSTFWAMVNTMSEPGGYFHSDNFVSNELGFQFVIPDLLSSVGTGGTYLGVGPDQNFTYVVALRPRIAFIVDIRRQNMIQHLMYKALIEMSSDRAEFLGRLFSRRWTDLPPPRTRIDSLFSWLSASPRDTVLFEENLAAIVTHLASHGIALDAADRSTLEYVYSAFYGAGPALSYTAGGATWFLGRSMPSYRTLMTATGADGVNHGYLGSEENFAILKDLEERNLIVPLVGDFAGPAALRAVGEWLRRQDATVGVFYVSNVEQYLFQQGDAWRRFYGNVTTLPLHRHALFIRSVRIHGYMPRQHPLATSLSVTSPIADLLDLFRAGQLQSYADIVDLAR